MTETPPLDPSERLPIFYGRRRGRRLRKGKAGLIDTLLPELTLLRPEPGTRVDPTGWFGTAVVGVWLEIGFGSGEHLAVQAQANPALGLIGCEPFLNGVAGLLAHLEREQLTNVRIFPDDARLLLDALPDASIGRCFVLFGDPWPKLRHRDRRFICPANLDRLSRVLIDGAELRMASDDPVLIAWMIDHSWHHPDFEWLAHRAEDWRTRPADWPPTRYELKAIEAGRKPVFLRFRRRLRASRPG